MTTAVFVRSTPLAVVLLGLIFGLQTANADFFDITITDATFAATCVGGTGTCTETVNGSFAFDSLTFAASSVSLVLSGTLATTLNGYGGAGFGPGLMFLDFFDDTVTGFTPINLGLALPDPLVSFSGPLDPASSLFVPPFCGGLPSCDALGSFPTGTYFLTSGTATVQPVPEPSSFFLLIAGMIALTTRMSWRVARHVAAKR